MGNAQPPVVTESIAENLWVLHADGNRFLGAVEIYNNALLIKAEDGLVVVNPVSQDPRYVDAVKQLVEREHVKLSAIISPGDWHHFNILYWARAFPEANVYVASERVLKKQPDLKRMDRVTVLSREACSPHSHPHPHPHVQHTISRANSHVAQLKGGECA